MKLKKNSSYILIHKNPSQTEALWCRGSDVLSYSIYSPSRRSQVGSIYRGEVTRVLPGIGAGFVNIGCSSEVFLHQKEILGDFEEDTPIQEKIQVGQKITVQIIKDSIGSKSARASMLVRLVGSKLIYMPQVQENIGISRKIADEKERERLKEILSKLEVKGKVIVRTKAVGQKNFKKEMNHLLKTWNKIQKNSRKSTGLIFEDIPEEIQFLRSGLEKDTQVFIDDLFVYKKAVTFVKNFLPEFKNQIVHYTGTDLFKKFSADKKLKQAYTHKVYLKSGGVLNIEPTEALVSIDVNTAKATEKKSPETIILNTNLEAVKEIATQLRIRNLGGIIVIDLINMDLPSSQEKVVQTLKNELLKDPNPVEFVSISSLQLVQLVRKRTQKSLREISCQKCPSCEGKGYVKSPQWVALEIFKKVLADKKLSSEVVVKCHPRVREWIQENEEAYLNFMLKKYKKRFKFKDKENNPLYYFEFDKSHKNVRKSSVKRG